MLDALNLRALMTPANLRLLGAPIFIIMIQNVFNLFGIYPFVQKVITGAFIVIAV